MDELKGNSQLVPWFGSGACCMCEELEAHGRKQECGSCLLNDGQRGHVIGFEDQQKHGVIHKQLYQLHAATGHGSVRNLVDALKKRGVSNRVLELAKNFQCPVCSEKHKVSTSMWPL